MDGRMGFPLLWLRVSGCVSIQVPSPPLPVLKDDRFIVASVSQRRVMQFHDAKGELAKVCIDKEVKRGDSKMAEFFYLSPVPAPPFCFPLPPPNHKFGKTLSSCSFFPLPSFRSPWKEMGCINHAGPN